MSNIEEDEFDEEEEDNDEDADIKAPGINRSIENAEDEELAQDEDDEDGVDKEEAKEEDGTAETRGETVCTFSVVLHAALFSGISF